MHAVSFTTVWANYPKQDPCHDLRGRALPGYENQCAIRVGVALERSGVSFHSFRGNRCPGAGPASGMVASAQQLARWLERHPIAGSLKAEKYTGSNLFAKIEDRSGIVFLGDYWRRPTDRAKARTGDHIDLWNGSRFTEFSSWFRVHWGVSYDGFWSDYRRASSALFFPVP